LSYSTLAKIERGAIKAPSIFTIESIAEALGTTLDQLIGRQPAAPTIPKQRQRSKSGVSFVYFDVNGCLVRSYQRAFSKLAHDSGQTADTVETIFWHYNDQVCRGEMSMADFNRVLAEQLKMNLVDWTEYYLKGVEPMPDMGELVSWASELYGVGLMTNIMPGLLMGLRQRSIVPNIAYDAIIDSSEVHAIKPESKIYEKSIERAACRPAEILFIDDSRANIMAAEKFGLHVLWFDDSRPEESASRIRQALEPTTAETRAPVVTETVAAVSPVVSDSGSASPFLVPRSVETPA
jgi:FMN phosphatase YigB (HAD superfamily)